MSGISNQRIGLVDSCLDYQSYVYNIDPALTRAQYEVSCRRLMAVGNVAEERMGVVYVRGFWGFFVIPCYGYPTLRASFFHDTPEAEINDVLSMICAAFETSDSINDQGDLDE
ncbi:MAG: hypothetical protein PVJ39_13370 [Gammaproteobacteria bacterium]|jgi:hypothetical protein